MSSPRRYLKLTLLAGTAMALAGCCVLPFGHGHGRGHYGSAQPHRYQASPPGPPIGEGRAPYRRGVTVH